MFSTSEWNVALDAMRGLQEAAVEVDAEPGENAGVHVHVKAPRGERRKARAYLAWLAWEDAVITLAQGRFPYLRGMNRRVVGDLGVYLDNRGDIEVGTYDDRTPATIAYIDGLLARARTGDDWQRAFDLYAVHYDADRHSHLSVNTRFGTWEFRVWNSTRSAWRMELACRLAVAWADADFIDCLLNHEGTRTEVDLLDIVSVHWQGDDRLASLIHRQVDYLPTRHETPARFLVA